MEKKREEDDDDDGDGDDNTRNVLTNINIKGHNFNQKGMKYDWYAVVLLNFQSHKNKI